MDTQKIKASALAWIKRFWWLIAVGIVAIILFRGCKAGPDHAPDLKTVDSAGTALAAKVAAGEQRIAVLQADSIRKEGQIDSLIADKLNMERDLADRGQIITRTITIGQQARVNKDTAGIVSNCDSLVKEVEAARDVVGGYEALTDSLLNDEVTQRVIQDSIAANWKNLFLAADTTARLTQAKYDQLYKDYAKVNRKLKFGNVMGKIGAGVIAALSIFLIIKK